MSRKSIKPVAGAIGAAIAGSMLLGNAANAATNPFGMTELNSGYMQVASAADGKCGGSMKAQAKPMADGKCGGSMKQAMPKKKNGKCGANKKMKK